MQYSEKVRLDKWLWAARFYKTRAMAKTAIEGGKVHYEGQRVKPGRLVQTGATLDIRQGYDVKQVIVNALSERRGTATFAHTLYEETSESIERREREQALRKAANRISDKKPDKKQRRQIHRFQRRQAESDDT